MDSNFHFLYFSVPCLQGFLRYLLSAFVLSAPVPKHLYLQNLGSTSSIHRKHTGFTCKSLKYSPNSWITAFFQGWTHVGCLQQYIKSVLKMLFDKVLTIIKISRLCTISYEEEVSVYCVLYISTTVTILPATELSATSVC